MPLEVEPVLDELRALVRHGIRGEIPRVTRRARYEKQPQDPQDSVLLRVANLANLIIAKL